MKILTCEQIRRVDQFTINHEPVFSVDLMERAAAAAFLWLKEHFGKFGKVKIFVGPGNNGGDGLAIARMLADEGIDVSVYVFSAIEKLSPDAFVNYNRLVLQGKVELLIIDSPVFPEILEDDIVIDALFGSGLSRPLDGWAAQIVERINQHNAVVVSIDIPSGLFGEDNAHNKSDTIVKADYTLTFQMPKLAFFFAENADYVGNLSMLDINLSREAIGMEDSFYSLNMPADISALLKKRGQFSHKGIFGHALLIAGSYGKMGAAVLASGACLRTGVGLLTVQIPKVGYDIMQISIPEAMVVADSDNFQISEMPATEKFSSVGIGPGIGTSEPTASVLLNIISNTKAPMVLDADALNILSLHPEWIRKLPPNSIITPHPREFDRIAGPSVNGYERHLKQMEFSKINSVIVILKGAYTSITSPDGYCYFNPTGNPGMATAGSGDVLTGIVLSLLAQGYKPIDAACLGVYLHGLAGDLAVENLSEEALIASDIIKHLGLAFKKLKSLTNE
jgi:ADP-dependent NAD(P)H-hydrate dehydratase / NAD(P)H-hydrate epimerase